MYLKYKANKNNNIETIFRVKDEYAIIINDEEYEFDMDSTIWPDIAEQTNYVILEAYKENSKLYVTILRQYTGSCPWDDGKYHEVLV